MADTLTPTQRRRNMQRIRGRDTKPELLLRRGMHARGFRYRLHARALPGRPDLTFPKHRVVIFVHGCFWHGHNCQLFKWPKTRQEFWRKKILANRIRDKNSVVALREADWRVLIVWECALHGKERHPIEDVLTEAADFLTDSDADFREISCKNQSGKIEQNASVSLN